MMKVFVYGTLKSNYGNNHRLIGGKFVKEAFVKDFMLLDCGFPVARKNDGTFVKGEIWDIGDTEGAKGRAILEGLDNLEGYRESNPEGSMYVRENVTTECGEDVQMYVGNRESFLTLEPCPSSENIYEWSYVRRYGS